MPAPIQQLHQLDNRNEVISPKQAGHEEFPNDNVRNGNDCLRGRIPRTIGLDNSDSGKAKRNRQEPGENFATFLALRLVASSTSLLAKLTGLRIPVDYLDSLYQTEMLQGDS